MAKRAKYNGKRPLDFQHSNQLDTNLERLEAGHIMTQFFAIFIEPDIPFDEKWQHALEQIDLFYTEILEKNPQVTHIRKWSDLDDLQDGEIGAVLTLEGADAFGNDLMKLQTLYRLGVLAVGLTWNNANLCADGAGEPRGGGLTLFGKKVVELNNRNKVLTDVAHLSVNGFWDVIELADYPIASHSNARAICDHPRNLDDDQVEAMFVKNGLIQLVFNPPFIKKGSVTASITDLIRHIEHLCARGGVDKIGFGSDFDGISDYVTNLENTSQYPNLINELLKIYSEEQVKGFAYQNFLKYRRRYLS